MGTHAIKVKLPGEKIWYFAAPTSCSHCFPAGEAPRYSPAYHRQHAAEVAAEIEELNPGIRAKVVRVMGA